MKIAVHVLAYNVNRFLKTVLNNIEPHVDKIYVAHAERPWGYVQSSRDNRLNPTKLSDVISASSSSKIEIVQGDWLTEEDMRNACLNRAKADGFDWFIMQDADEFYAESTWEQIKAIMLKNKGDDLLRTSMYQFWKSSQYLIIDRNGNMKELNNGFALRCTSEATFILKRITNAKSPRVIDCPCYHYGYVMTDEEMKEKLSTWGHAQEVNANKWFKYKWLNWNESTINLHPTDPSFWSKAVIFPFHQPDFADEFALPINSIRNKSINLRLGDGFYNSHILGKDFYRYSKSLVKSIYKG